MQIKRLLLNNLPKIKLVKVNKKKHWKKGVKYVQSQPWKHQNNVSDMVLVFLLLTLNIFTSSSSVSTVDSEQVSVSWKNSLPLILYFSDF